MKEIDENSFDDEENSLKNKMITKNSINEFISVLNSKKYFYVQITELKQTYIILEKYSFEKINEMLEASPEENVVFIYDKKVAYSPKQSLRLSKRSIKRSSIQRSSKNSSFSSSYKNEKMKNLNEAIINTDINEPNIDTNIDTNIDNNINLDENIKTETPDNNNNQEEYIFNNNRNNSIGRVNKNSNNSMNNKCTLYKWIFHFYLFIGIIIFIDFLTFIFSKNIDSAYKWVSFLLFISLLYLGYSGLKNKNGNEKNFLFKGNILLLINYGVLILTIFCLMSLFYLENIDIFDNLMILIYFTTIIIEAIYILYYDIIQKVIFTDVIDNNKHFEEYNKNSLTIQLMEVT
jgi:hypothetical protein